MAVLSCRSQNRASDGGAHVAEHCDANYPTYLIGTWSRDKQLLSLEHAVKRLTSEPAELFGLADRGRLMRGMAADFVIFDYQTINSAARQHAVRDLPGGGLRFVTAAHGIEYTIVNGEVLFEGRNYTGARPEWPTGSEPEFSEQALCWRGPVVIYPCRGTSPRAIYVRFVDHHLSEEWIPETAILPGTEVWQTTDWGKLVLPGWFVRERGDDLPDPNDTFDDDE
jgi:Amidohydrolase family